MSCNPDGHRRRSIRLKDHDYSRPGAYFVTTCARDRECLFGDVAEGQMRLNRMGTLVAAAWDSLRDDDGGIALDAFVVMPNHVHGIIVITAGGVRGVVGTDVGAIHESPLQEPPRQISPGDATQSRRRMLVPIVVGRFKMTSAKGINALRATPGRPVWQRNYYEHVIRTEESFSRIRRYIAENPARWPYDRENPVATARSSAGAAAR